MNQPKFGKKPSGKRLHIIQNSPNWKNGEFQNVSITPALTEGISYSKVMKDFFFSKIENRKPVQSIPSEKVHSSKFALSTHSWNEPLEKITSLPNDNSIKILTPKIGEMFSPTDITQSFSKWWR